MVLKLQNIPYSLYLGIPHGYWETLRIIYKSNYSTVNETTSTVPYSVTNHKLFIMVLYQSKIPTVWILGGFFVFPAFWPTVRRRLGRRKSWSKTAGWPLARPTFSRRRLFVGLAGENRGQKPPVFRRQKFSRRRFQACCQVLLFFDIHSLFNRFRLL